MCHSYHYLHGIDVTVFRYFTVYGPGGRPDMSLFRFVQWISEEKPVLIFGDGHQTRDFTYVDDIARGTIAGLKPVGYEVINLGSDKPLELLGAVRIIEKLLGKQARLEFSPAHSADVANTWADISRAKSILGWEPETSYEAGIEKLVNWYLDNRSWAKDIETVDRIPNARSSTC
jgi:nucleoside-diphosphate-sugar epimerase